MPLSTIFANKVGRYRFAMACKKASTTTNTSIGRYGFMNRSNLIIFLYLRSNYRYIVFCSQYNDISLFVKGLTLTSTHNCLLRRRVKGKRRFLADYLPPRQGPPDPVRGASPPDTCPPDRVPPLYEYEGSFSCSCSCSTGASCISSPTCINSSKPLNNEVRPSAVIARKIARTRAINC